MPDFTIDINELVEQLKNSVGIKLIGAMCPDEKTKNTMTSTLQVFVDHGVDIETALLIMGELGNLFSKEENDG